MRSKLYLLFLALCFTLVLGSGPASANAGVPMLFLMWPVSWLLLVPIIIVEGAVLRNFIDLTRRRSVLVSAAANAASTLFGIPLTWLILLGIEVFLTDASAYGLETPVKRLLAFTVQAPWLNPYESALHWLVPAASLVLCVAFFLVSVFSERLVVRLLEPHADPVAVARWSWRANLITYGVVVGALLLLLITALMRHGLFTQTS